MTFELVRKVSEQEVMSASALNDLRQTALTCRGHTRPVTYLAFSDVTADGYFLASACKDGRAMLRLGSTGDWIGTLEKHKGAVWCVAINSLATRGVTASADHTVKIWDLLNGNEIHQLDHKGIVKSVAMSKNSNRIITCGQDRNLLMYRLDRIGQNSPEEFEGPEVGSRHVIYGSTEREIYVASEDGGLTLTDLRTGSIVSTHTFPDVIKDLRFNPCDKNSLLLCHGLQADVWDTRTQSVSKTFKLNSGVLSGDFHPSEQVVTLGCDDHKLYKYSTLDTEQFEISRGHFGPIHAVRYSPDGELIASGSEDGTVRLWQHNVGKTYGLWRGICPTASTPSTPRYNTSAPPFFPSSATGIMCNGVEKVSSNSLEEASCEEEEEEEADISNSIELEEQPQVNNQNNIISTDKKEETEKIPEEPQPENQDVVAPKVEVTEKGDEVPGDEESEIVDESKQVEIGSEDVNKESDGVKEPAKNEVPSAFGDAPPVGEAKTDENVAK